MEKIAMRTISINHPRHTGRHWQRYRLLLTVFLVLICIPIFFYHLVPSFTSLADKTMYNLSDNILGQTSRGEFCTRKIGDRHCCMLYLDASPCVDTCRKDYVDRETLDVTLAYDQCVDQCLVTYNKKCEPKEDGNPLEGKYRGT
jgi:hypothetical protein